MSSTEKFDAEASQYWDKFYRKHQSKFFKDRTWLFMEFPELLPSNASKEVTNSNVEDQQEAHRLASGCRVDTDSKHQQHVESADLHTSTDVSRRLEPHNGRNGDEDEAPSQSFPGHSASFRILEVIKTLSYVNICLDHCLCSFYSVFKVARCSSLVSQNYSMSLFSR